MSHKYSQWPLGYVLHHGSHNRASLAVTMIHVLLWAFNRTEAAAELILVAPIPNQKVVQTHKELHQHLSAASREGSSRSNLQTQNLIFEDRESL